MFNKYILGVVVGASGLALGATQGFATTLPTVNFDVTLTIESSCIIIATPDLDFGTTGVLNADVPAQADIEVQCTPDTGYTVGLSGGGAADVTAREMTGPLPAATSSIGYGLFRDAAYQMNWGNTSGTWATGTGNGDVQALTIYGLVPLEATTPPTGDYKDTITVTVTYN